MRSLILVAIFGLSLTVQAQVRGSKPLSPDDQKALQDTQDMMRNRQEIDAFTAKNPTAKGADTQVQNLMGDQTDATYDLAADIFGDLVKQAGGDPEKLMKLVEQAQKNPEAFASKLSPAQRAKIKEMAGKVEGRAVASPPH